MAPPRGGIAFLHMGRQIIGHRAHITLVIALRNYGTLASIRDNAWPSA